MSDDLEKRLLEVQTLIHSQVKLIDDYLALCNNPTQFDKTPIRVYVTRVFEILKDFYMNLEIMYITSEAGGRQTDFIKDAIFSLKEVRENPELQEKLNQLFSSNDEVLGQIQESFRKTYGIDEI